MNGSHTAETAAPPLAAPLCRRCHCAFFSTVYTPVISSAHGHLARAVGRLGAHRAWHAAIDSVAIFIAFAPFSVRSR